MSNDNRYDGDIKIILSKINNNGWNYWTTLDKRLIKGGQFSALSSTLLLLELGMNPTEPLLKEMTNLIFDSWQTDGRFKLYPNGTIYPCHTINATNVICHLGYATDKRIQKTFDHLFEIQHSDGGWRCRKFIFGKGPETEFSNPGPTLMALDAYRFTNFLNNDERLDKAVDFLLNHWTIRKPLGPCHYGIGTLFLQISYPFNQYNLFYYVYVLSFYNKAIKDKRFLEAFEVLKSKVVDEQIIIERSNSQLNELSFCQKGKVSDLATVRYHEILHNVDKNTV